MWRSHALILYVFCVALLGSSVACSKMGTSDTGMSTLETSGFQREELYHLATEMANALPSTGVLGLMPIGIRYYEDNDNHLVILDFLVSSGDNRTTPSYGDWTNQRLQGFPHWGLEIESCEKSEAFPSKFFVGDPNPATLPKLRPGPGQSGPQFSVFRHHRDFPGIVFTSISYNACDEFFAYIKSHQGGVTCNIRLHCNNSPIQYSRLGSASSVVIITCGIEQLEGHGATPSVVLYKPSPIAVRPVKP